MDILAQIIQAKRQRLAVARKEVPLDGLRDKAFAARVGAASHRLTGELGGNSELNVIAEYKRRSPSKGNIRKNIGAADMARFYKKGGAIAISVLTEQDYFAGSLDDMQQVKEAVALPVLRKDFVIDEYQVFESVVAGADAILLIAAILDDKGLVSLRKLAEDALQIDALVEVHTQTEMQRAIASGARLIGVNNRDLKTFDISLETSLSLAAMAPEHSLLVAESGLQSHGELRQLQAAGYHGFLVGEMLMRAAHPDAALRELRTGSEAT